MLTSNTKHTYTYTNTHTSTHNSPYTHTHSHTQSPPLHTHTHTHTHTHKHTHHHLCAQAQAGEGYPLQISGQTPRCWMSLPKQRCWLTLPGGNSSSNRSTISCSRFLHTSRGSRVTLKRGAQMGRWLCVGAYVRTHYACEFTLCTPVLACVCFNTSR